MASVTSEILNKRQLLNLENKNKGWVKDGIVPNDGVMYNHCNRCEDLGIAPRFKPISEFTFHGSRSDGCSSYCTKCLESSLNKEEAFHALALMNDALVPAIDGELVLQNEQGEWKPVSQFENPKKVLQRNLSRPTPPPPPPVKNPINWAWVRGVVGALVIVGAITWAVAN